MSGFCPHLAASCCCGLNPDRSTSPTIAGMYITNSGYPAGGYCHKFKSRHIGVPRRICSSRRNEREWVRPKSTNICVSVGQSSAGKLISAPICGPMEVRPSLKRLWQLPSLTSSAEGRPRRLRQRLRKQYSTIHGVPCLVVRQFRSALQPIGRIRA